MAILASEGEKKEFYLLPAETMQGVCYDVWDIGLQKTVFNGEEKVQHKVIIAFETSELIPTGVYAGKRATISKKYTLSLGDKANLRKDLTSWRGKEFTADELMGFDIEKLIGANCMLSIVHNQSKDKTYANIGSISKVMKGLPLMIPENKRSTPEWVAKLKAQAVSAPAPQEEEEVPPPSGDEEPLPF